MTKPVYVQRREWTDSLRAARDAMKAANASTDSSMAPTEIAAVWRDAQEVQRSTRARVRTLRWMPEDEKVENEAALASMEALCDKMIAVLGQTDVPYAVEARYRE